MTKQLIRRNAVLVALLASCLVVSHTSAETVLVKLGQDTHWRYQDDGKALGAEWREPEFDDSSWHLGPAPLGYGDSGLNTTVSFGDDENKKHITTYFRSTFRVEDAQAFETLVLLVRSDDGIIVYLNGDEIIRDNLPEGDIQFTSTATRRKDRLDERLYSRFAVPAATLVSGANVSHSIWQMNAEPGPVVKDGSAGIATVSLPGESALVDVASKDDRLRRMVLGTWHDEYQGKRTLTLRDDGTGTMAVELLNFRLIVQRGRPTGARLEGKGFEGVASST